MTILSKFKVDSTTDFGNDNLEVKTTPVIGGSEENKSFSKYTPSGEIRLHITNPNVLGFFEAGSEYYVEFKKAEAVGDYDRLNRKLSTTARLTIGLFLLVVFIGEINVF